MSGEGAVSRSHPAMGKHKPKRITGTHVYTMLRCPRAVALDLHEDKSKRRPLTEAEEFVRQRGRQWEGVLPCAVPRSGGAVDHPVEIKHRLRRKQRVSGGAFAP